MGLDGQETDLGTVGSDFWPIAYLAEKDSVILQGGRIGSTGAEEYPVWLYSFSTGELIPIAENLSLGKRAVYARERVVTL
jgi:hypothetical protein